MVERNTAQDASSPAEQPLYYHQMCSVFFRLKTTRLDVTEVLRASPYAHWKCNKISLILDLHISVLILLHGYASHCSCSRNHGAHETNSPYFFCFFLQWSLLLQNFGADWPLRLFVRTLRFWFCRGCSTTAGHCQLTGTQVQSVLVRSGHQAQSCNVKDVVAATADKCTTWCTSACDSG